jgi:hypothetical protein
MLMKMWVAEHKLVRSLWTQRLLKSKHTYLSSANLLLDAAETLRYVRGSWEWILPANFLHQGKELEATWLSSLGMAK